MGNPDLDPEYTNSFELGYLQYLKRGSFLSSLYYRHRTGVIERINQPDSTGQNIRIPVNLSVQHAWGLELSGNYDITKWWKLNGSFNFSWSVTDGEYEGTVLHAETWAWNGRLTSKTSFGKGWEGQLTF